MSLSSVHSRLSSGWLFIWLNLLDVVSTILLLRAGAAEFMPVARFVLAHGGLSGFVLFKAAGAGAVMGALIAAHKTRLLLLLNSAMFAVLSAQLITWLCIEFM